MPPVITREEAPAHAAPGASPRFRGRWAVLAHSQVLDDDIRGWQEWLRQAVAEAAFDQGFVAMGSYARTWIVGEVDDDTDWVVEVVVDTRPAELFDGVMV